MTWLQFWKVSYLCLLKQKQKENFWMSSNNKIKYAGEIRSVVKDQQAILKVTKLFSKLG